jgi:hypothetical protein
MVPLLDIFLRSHILRCTLHTPSQLNLNPQGPHGNLHLKIKIAKAAAPSIRLSTLGYHNPL